MKACHHGSDHETPDLATRNLAPWDPDERSTVRLGSVEVALMTEWTVVPIPWRPRRGRLADGYNRNTGWHRYQDCRERLTDGYGNPERWWNELLSAACVPLFMLLTFAFEFSGIRLDR